MWPFGKLTLRMLAEKIKELTIKLASNTKNANENFLDIGSLLRKHQQTLMNHRETIERLVEVLKQAGILEVRDVANEREGISEDKDKNDKLPKKETIH